MDEPIQLIQPEFRGSALQRSDTHSGHVTFISEPLCAVLCTTAEDPPPQPHPLFSHIASVLSLLICFLFLASFLEQNLMNQILEKCVCVSGGVGRRGPLFF